MLLSLDIRNMLIIRQLTLEFQPGLNVLTGETGAGKSILLDALGFVLGWRGRADLVREGADQGVVVAEFALPPNHLAHTILQEAGLPVEETLLLRRVNARDGRKTAYVNDQRCSGEILRNLSDTLVELHGQHDDRGLLNPRGHRRLLDDFAQAPQALTRTRKTWQSLRTARNALDHAEAAFEAARAEEDFLRHAVSELDQLDPTSGEEADLDTKRRLMQAAERIRDDVIKAGTAISSNGAEGALVDATRWLEGVADKAEGQLDAPLQALSRALVELAEAQQGVENCLHTLAADPTELEAVEERLFAVRGLARKHGVAPDALGDLALELRQKLADLDAGEAQITSCRDALKTAQALYDQEAASLYKLRRDAARKLDKAMARELAPLKMERAVFKTEISEAEPGPDGKDAAAFTVATNPGAPAGPLNKIASGGELSRFLLALKVCLTAEAKGLTMIFDEIDRGVGGATADAVGRRLSALAKDAQVLVVTHSPQVAALGAHHWRVEKTVRDNTTTSSVVALSQEQRVDEIARMLSADRITDAAKAAAQALLNG